MVRRNADDLEGIYDEAFFARQKQLSAESAAIMVPRIVALFPDTSSVIDVGCGTGTWLRAFRDCGVADVLGVDGGAMDHNLAAIEPGLLLHADLRAPLPVTRRFDLALSLEVAEHLQPEYAEGFVDTLCALSDVVVFGAAIPGQGGFDHLNERWPSFWSGLFAGRQYLCFDVLRPQVWADERVAWWYAQNTLVFVHKRQVGLVRRLAAEGGGDTRIIDIVHPRCYGKARRKLESRRKPLVVRLLRSMLPHSRSKPRRRRIAPGSG